MGNITLRREVFGSGYTGTIRVPTGLSWMDSTAIQRTADSAWRTSVELQHARRAMDRLDRGVGEVADAIDQLEASIGLRLDAQTRVLERQAAALDEIRDAVVNPSKTRAAERIADGAQLLQNERYERALKVAEEAIDADPNNPNGFFVAGWALVGLERFEEARPKFEEARDASSGDQRSLGCRQAARTAFLAGKPDLAYALCRDARVTAQGADELAAVNYDVAVYASAVSDPESALVALEQACRHDSRHAERAVFDPAFEQAAEMRDVAGRVLSETAEAIAQQRDTVKEAVASSRASMPDPPRRTDREHAKLDPGMRPPQDWRRLLTSVEQELSDLERTASAEGVATSSLQEVAGALKAAEKRIALLDESQLPLLREAVALHDAAAERQDVLERELSEVSARRDSWRWAVPLRARVARGGGWVVAGIVLCLIGILLPAALLLGGAILLVLALMYGLGSYAEQRQVIDERAIDEITEELGRRG